MKKSIYLSMLLILITIVFGCASLQKNYGRVKIIPKAKGNVTIQDLIDKWEDYNIYYSGQSTQLVLGVMFDPKTHDTTLKGDMWKPITSKKELIEATEWIYLNTDYQPWLNEILGPDGLFYGYLYYSYGHVVLKVKGDKEIYVFDLDERLGGEGLMVRN